MGARIRAYSKRLGLSPEVVARRLAKSQRWLQKVGAGEPMVEKLDDVPEVADVLHGQPSELVDRPVPHRHHRPTGQNLMVPLRGRALGCALRGGSSPVRTRAHVRRLRAGLPAAPWQALRGLIPSDALYHNMLI